MFFGLISIPEYAYRYKLSTAKIELLLIDQPRVDYDTNKNPKTSKNIVVDANDEAHKLQEIANQKRAERLSLKQVNLSDIK